MRLELRVVGGVLERFGELWGGVVVAVVVEGSFWVWVV